MSTLSLSRRLAIRPSFTQLSPTTLDKGGVPANAWRFASNTPVRRAEGGYWLRAS